MQGEFWSTTPTGSFDQRAAEWHDMLSATHLQWTTKVDPGVPSFAAWVRRHWIDDLALVDCECDPCSGTRSRPQIAATDGEFVTVLMTHAGRETVTQNGSEANLSPGDAVVWTSTAPASFTVWASLTKRSLIIPQAALDEVSGRREPKTGLRLDGTAPAVRLLISYLDALSRTAPELAPAAVVAARNAALDLVIGGLHQDSRVLSSSTVQPALRLSMDRWIEAHLPAGPISPDDVAAAHGVSVRTVHRTYRASGHSFGEAIRTRRLARARADVVGSKDPIGSIASRWGFADTSHFSRTFKAKYGMAPSEYRAQALTDRP